MTTALDRDHGWVHTDWIRPWYPGHVPAHSTTGQFEAHIDADCERLRQVRPEPVEGCGWLDPDDPLACKSCKSIYEGLDEDEDE